MRIGYAYEFPADDVNVQSGYPFFILGQLEKRARIERVFPLRQLRKYAFVHKAAYYRARGQVYRPDREPLLLKSFAAQIARRLRAADCVFSPSSIALSYLETDLPKVFLADATFANVVDAYADWYGNCAPEYLGAGHDQERRALAGCAAAIYPTEWAARSAIADYHADPGKVHVIPFGANVEAPPADLVAATIDRKRSDPFRLLFIGRDWLRKGGDIVLAAADIARRRGVPVRLDLVGLDAVPAPLPDYAVNHGLLLKSDRGMRDRLEDLLLQAHLVFVPSRAENYGIAFCEAAAYGVPSLSSDAGGIPTIVRDGVSGYNLPCGSAPEAYARVIEASHADRDRYRDLARASRRFYETTLNWEAFGERLMQVLGRIA
jgi:glycosyltransferase involved in cell wall biosynthesis